MDDSLEAIGRDYAINFRRKPDDRDRSERPWLVVCRPHRGGLLGRRCLAGAAMTQPEALREALIERLRSVAAAYPDTVFLPLDDEDKKHPLTIQRASATMGRHMAPLLLEAAAALEAQGAPERGPDFETVWEGGGYRHRADGHGGATLIGARCPKCGEVFQPVIGVEPTCPKCGYTRATPQAAIGAEPPVAWEYRNQYGNPFLTHDDPAKWHEHARRCFNSFRPLYAAPAPIDESLVVKGRTA